MEAKKAIEISELWEAGKMIGADGGKVRKALLKEVKRLQCLSERLSSDLEDHWLWYHNERCTNMEDCASFGNPDKECHAPRPKSLDEEI